VKSLFFQKEPQGLAKEGELPDLSPPPVPDVPGRNEEGHCKDRRVLQYHPFQGLVLTNAEEEDASAEKIASLYRKR